jgi:hypothetical protein
MRCQKCANRLGSEGSPSSLKWWKICRLKVGNLNKRNCTICPWWINSTHPRRHKSIPTMCSWQAALEARWHPSDPLSWIRPHFAPHCSRIMSHHVTSVESCSRLDTFYAMFERYKSNIPHQVVPSCALQALIKMHCIELHSEQHSYGALPRGG